jgi:hypothetical protein
LPKPAKQKRFIKDHLNWAGWCVPVIPAWEAQAGTSRFQDQPGLHSKILSQNKTDRKKKKKKRKKKKNRTETKQNKKTHS